MSADTSPPGGALEAALEQLKDAYEADEHVLEAAESLRDQAARDGDPQVEAEAGLLVAQALHDRSDLREALEAASDAHEVFEAVPDPRGELEALKWIGKLLAKLGDIPEARRIFEKGLDTAESVGRRGLRGSLLACLAFTYGSENESEPYVELTREAIAEFRADDQTHPEKLALALGNLGGGLTHLGNLEDARRAYRESTKLATKIGHTRAEALATGGLAEIALLEGDDDTARRLTPEARDLFLDADAPWDAIHHGNVMAERSLERGEPEFALKFLAPLDELFDGQDFLGLRVDYHTLRSRALEALGRFERALEALKERNRWREVQIDERERQRMSTDVEASDDHGEPAQIESLRNALIEAQDERRKLAVAASTDPLTGLFNRRSLKSLGDDYLEQSRSEQHPLSVVVVDLDEFKGVNDAYGHPAGDEVLRRAAARIADSMRSSDLVARTGGEEFAIVMPNTTAEQAAAIADRLRGRIAETFRDIEGHDIDLTASFGVAQLRDEDELDDLLQRADEALYVAKRTGRNRVEFAPGDRPSADDS